MNNIESLQQYADFMKGRASDSTIRLYVSTLRLFLAHADGNALSPAFAQRYIDSLSKQGKATSTIAVRANAIMSFFKSKKIEAHIDYPTIVMKMPEYLKKNQLDDVIKACRTQLERTLVVMLYDTAVRISELLNLELVDIDWDNKIITVIRKGGRRTEVNVSDKALTELKAWVVMRQSSSSKVFLNLEYYTAWSMIKDIGTRVSILNIHPHIFRHSRAIHMLRAGVPINIVSQHLGHKSIATTINIYGQFTTPDVREQLAPW